MAAPIPGTAEVLAREKVPWWWSCAGSAWGLSLRLGGCVLSAASEEDLCHQVKGLVGVLKTNP